MEIENGSSKGRYNVILEKEADPSGRSPLLRVELITDYPEMSKIQDPRSKTQGPRSDNREEWKNSIDCSGHRKSPVLWDSNCQPRYQIPAT